MKTLALILLIVICSIVTKAQSIKDTSSDDSLIKMFNADVIEFRRLTIQGLTNIRHDDIIRLRFHSAHLIKKRIKLFKKEEFIY